MANIYNLHNISSCMAFLLSIYCANLACFWLLCFVQDGAYHPPYVYTVSCLEMSNSTLS